jgi:oligopeptide transport system substrate-binding protein
LAAFFVLFPVNRECVEQFGYPEWTKAENAVTNGPYRLTERRLRQKIRMTKNENYWSAADTKINTIDALAVESETTSLNMFMTGEVDWVVTIPTVVAPELIHRPDFRSAPMMTTNFYRFNTKRKPLDDPRVRQALSMAIDKKAICERILRAGQVPALTLVPPGMANYQSPPGLPYDPERARKLLAEAGYPGGAGFPKLQILYNTADIHKAVAEVIQRQWRANLGISMELKNLEWKVFLDALHKMEFDVARSGWTGDYPDPNTFVDMFVKDGVQNETGWSSPEYDQLVAAAAKETNSQTRMQMLHDAEAILTEGAPIIPLYYSVSLNMVQPRVKHFYENLQDIHPLHVLEVDPQVPRQAPSRSARQ